MKLYPHDTRFKDNVTLQLKRYLPRRLKGSTDVSKGQEVSPVSVVARAEMDQGYHVFDGRAALDISADEVTEYVTVGLGVQVRRTAPLLEKPKRFGRNQIVDSPVEGILEDIIDGRLLIRRTPREQLVRSALNGWIVHVESGRGVEIETTGSQIEVAWGCGKEGYGDLEIIGQLPDSLPEKGEVTDKAQASILVFGRVDSSEMIEHAIARGARGLIIGSMTADVFARAGTFEVPIYLTDGVHRSGMSAPIFDLLNKGRHKTVSLLGIESGKTRRPEVVISESRQSVDMSLVKPSFSEVAVGQPVRLLRPPYVGEIGKIHAVYTHARQSEMNYLTAGADVMLSDGNVVFVPDSNLDIIM